MRPVIELRTEAFKGPQTQFKDSWIVSWMVYKGDYLSPSSLFLVLNNMFKARLLIFDEISLKLHVVLDGMCLKLDIGCLAAWSLCQRSWTWSSPLIWLGIFWQTKCTKLDEGFHYSKSIVKSLRGHKEIQVIWMLQIWKKWRSIVKQTCFG